MENKMKHLYIPDRILCTRTEIPAGAGLLLFEGKIDGILIPPFPSGIESTDIDGSDIVPFLTDFHLHFSVNALSISQEVERALLKAGIGRVYDGGDPACAGIAMKENFREKIEILSAGWALSIQGGYGGKLGRSVAGAEEALVMIDDLFDKGADHIKVINSGIFMPETGTISEGGWDRDALAMIISHATERGMEAVCHANGDRAIRDAVSAGASMIIHGFHASHETLCIMRDHNCKLVPTIAALAGLERITKEDRNRRRIRDMVLRHMEMVAHAYVLGVKVLPGSDAGPSFLPYGKTWSDELVLLTKTGMSVHNVITESAREVFQKGMSADFLVVKGHEVKKVFVQGKCVFENPG